LSNTEGVRWRPRQRGRDKSGQGRHEPLCPTWSGPRHSSPRWLPHSHMECASRAARLHPPTINSATVAPLSKHGWPADHSLSGVDDWPRSTTVAGAGTARQRVRDSARLLSRGTCARLLSDPGGPWSATDRMPRHGRWDSPMRCRGDHSWVVGRGLTEGVVLATWHPTRGRAGCGWNAPRVVSAVA